MLRVGSRVIYVGDNRLYIGDMMRIERILMSGRFCKCRTERGELLLVNMGDLVESEV